MDFLGTNYMMWIWSCKALSVVIPAKAEILMVQFILHWQFLLKPEIEFKIIEPGDRWFYPL